jgi:glycosyltransferase involved in cell wall biosynthesis
MPSVYAALDIVVLPSWHEGFPYSLLEAQSCGIPAIASEVTGNVDAIIPEVTGLLVPPRDPVALSAAMKRLIDQPGLRRRLGESATERVRQSFSRERVVADHVAVYAEQVSPVPSP